MSRWKSVVTATGLNLLSNVTDTKAINIVRIGCGSGKVEDEQMEKQTAITNYVMDMDIIEAKQIDGAKYNIKGRVDSVNVLSAFNLTQIGVYATLGDNKNEVLFLLIQCTDEGDRIPTEAMSPSFKGTYVTCLEFSNNENVNIIVNNDEYVTNEEFDSTTADIYAYIDLKYENVINLLDSKVDNSELTNYAEMVAELDQNGYALLNGLLIQWGNLTVNSTGNSTVTFPIEYEELFNVQVTPLNVVNELHVYSKTNTFFGVFLGLGVSGNGSVNWLAIGKKVGD